MTDKNTIDAVTSVMSRWAVAAVVASLGTSALSAPAPASAVESGSVNPCATTSHSKDWKSAVTSANTALSRALTNFQNGQYGKAAQHLRVVTHKTRIAHKAASALIGKPPGPESDDPPGVSAVTKVSGLEHRITVDLVPLFSDPEGQHVVGRLTHALTTADVCRHRMLNKVIALGPGKRDDYSDNLADTLPGYRKELTAIQTELSGEALTASGRTALQDAERVVSATQIAMQKAFGGGERSPVPR